MHKKKLGMIGHFGGGHEFLDGQTVKTKVLYEELQKAGYEDIVCVDTYYNKTNKWKLLIDSVKCILTCKTIVILLSCNGMKIYFPMMYFAKKMLGRRVFHDVIGGNLAQRVRENPKYKKYLASFDANFVEFGKMKEELSALGITNCVVLPNFKRLHAEAAKCEIDDEAKHAFCMFSRVMEEKGMSEAICAIARYNATHDEKAMLHIWGPIDEGYREEFERLLAQYGEFVLYRGKVDYQKSVETLTDHLALLFPTHWESEGFPGTITDAFTAALPVVASDWNANAELIDNFKTGFVYPNEHIQTLYEGIEWCMGHLSEMSEMRRHALEKAKRYTPEVCMPTLLNLLESSDANKR